jgi:hypothetical protein
VRKNFLLLSLLVVGCGPGNRGPAAGPAPAPVSVPITAPHRDGDGGAAAADAAADKALYADEEIERLVAGQTLQLRSGEGAFLLATDRPTLPLGQAFRKVGIEERRLRRLGWEHYKGGFFPHWQASPNYQLSVVTDDEAPGNKELGLFDPERQVRHDIWFQLGRGWRGHGPDAPRRIRPQP